MLSADRRLRSPVLWILALLMVIVGAPPPLAAAGVKIGMNVAPIDYWSPGAPFIDRYRGASTWGSPNGLPIIYGADGEPTNAPIRPDGGFASFSRNVYIDDPVGTRFVLTWEGDGAVGFPWGRTVSVGDHRVVVEWTDAGGAGYAMLQFTGALPKAVHLVREDEEAAFLAGAQFRPSWIADMRGVSHLRFLDWTDANSYRGTSYPIADTGLPYGNQGDQGRRPVPFDVQIDLCNELGVDLWFPIPHTVDDATIQALAVRAKARLKPGLHAIFEYSNEMWNTGFGQAQFAQAQPGGAAVYYGQQLARVAKLVRASDQWVVAMWQFVVPDRIDPAIAAYQAAGGQLADLKAIGGADYIESGLNDYQNPIGPQLLAKNDVAGAIALLRGDLPRLAALHAQWATKAKALGLEYWTYEGVQYHLGVVFFPQRDQLVPFYATVQREPAAGAIVGDEATQAFAAGASRLTIYNYASPPSTAGYFGIRDTAAWPVLKALIAANYNTPAAANDNATIADQIAQLGRAGVTDADLKRARSSLSAAGLTALGKMGRAWQLAGTKTFNASAAEALTSTPPFLPAAERKQVDGRWTYRRTPLGAAIAR